MVYVKIYDIKVSCSTIFHKGRTYYSQMSKRDQKDTKVTKSRQNEAQTYEVGLVNNYICVNC